MTDPNGRRSDPVGIYDRPDAADRRPKIVRMLVIALLLGLVALGYLLVTP